MQTTKPTRPPATNQANMYLLPLHSLLNIPSESLTIVVDNAMSPQKSVSFGWQSRQKKRLRDPSSDNKHDGGRCSAISLPPLMSPEDAMEPCKEGNVLRASGVHDEVDCCSTSMDHLLGAPAQQESENNLAKDKNSLSQLLPEEVTAKNRFAVSNRCSSSTLKKIPVPQGMAKSTQGKLGMKRPCSRSLSLNSITPFKSEHSEYMMSVEAMQPSRSLDFLPVFVEQEFQGMTTAELIEKALENVRDL